MKRKGMYVDLSEDDNKNLVITLTEEGKDIEFQEMVYSLCESSAIFTILEDHLCNSSLCTVLPEQVGALTDSIILSDVLEMDENNNVISCNYVYWYPEYQVLDPIRELFEKGKVVFTYQE